MITKKLRQYLIVPRRIFDMRAARIVEVNRPLELQDLQTPMPKGSQVLVKVEATGVCHSDTHLWEGGY
ncbi:MAG: hypothetical protein ACRD5H_12735 [Nitrososphaerales archaeon]